MLYKSIEDEVKSLRNRVSSLKAENQTLYNQLMETEKAAQMVIGEPQEKYDAMKDGANNVYGMYREYKDAEEQGLLIKLPCKVGDVVHKIRKCRAPGCKTCGGYKRVDNCYCEYKARIFETSFIYSYIEEYGFTVFLTREEAEEALKSGASE